MGIHFRRSALLAAATAVVIGAGACNSEQASVLEPAGALAFNFPLGLTAGLTPRGSVRKVVNATTPANDTTRITLTGLQALAVPAAYQVWLGKENSTKDSVTGWVKATGILKVVSVDTIVDQFGDPKGRPRLVSRDSGVSSFSVGGPRIIDTLIVTTGTLGTDPAAYNVVLMTVEDDPSAAGLDPDKSTIRPLWVRLGTAKTGTFSFGNFAPNPANQYVFKPSGRGLAGVRDNILIVDDSLLSRPPVGYYYATHLVRVTPLDATAGTTDTVSYMLGPQHLPYPNRDQSLENADVQLFPGYVVANPPTVLSAGVRLKIDTLTAAGPVNAAQPYVYFRQVLVTLESKKADLTQGPSPDIILIGTFSDLIAKPKS